MPYQAETTKEESQKKAEIAERFGQIRRYLLGKHLERKEIVILIDISSTSYYNYEKGYSHIPSDVLSRIQDRLGISSDWILGSFPIPYALNEKGVELMRLRYGQSYNFAQVVADYIREIESRQQKKAEPDERKKLPEEQPARTKRRSTPSLEEKNKENKAPKRK